MTKPRLYLDCTRVSVVIKCRDCEYWSAFRFTKLEGWRSAARHEALCHPGSYEARDALWAAEQAAERAAEHAATVL